MMTKRPAQKRKTARKVTPKSKPAAAKTGPVCELCGKRGNVRQTDCCAHWICDDERNYALFSFARNSCDRNHRRHTLCGFHFNNGHEGSWKDCKTCREEFATEIYVHFGTNEYNFEVLENPPAFEPTKCAQCQQTIDLGNDGYSMKGRDHFCERCSALMLRRGMP